MSRIFEAYYPFGGAILSAVFFYLHPIELLLPGDKLNSLSNISLCVFPVSFGFAFASISLLISLIERPFIKGTLESGAFPLLIRYHLRCMAWCAAGFVFGASVQLLSDGNTLSFLGIFLGAVFIGTILATWRTVHLLLILLKCMKFY